MVLTQISRSYFKQSKTLYNANISFTFFKAIKNLFAHLTYLRFGLFCTFSSIFGEKYFYQKNSELVISNGKFGRFDVVLKLEFEVKI